jgi:hypothetical protein
VWGRWEAHTVHGNGSVLMIVYIVLGRWKAHTVHSNISVPHDSVYCVGQLEGTHSTL